LLDWLVEFPFKELDNLIYIRKMDEQMNSVIIQFLDDETKFHYLDYYYSKMLDETKDKEYVDQLYCLHLWRELEEPIWRYNEECDSDDESDDESDDDSDDDSDY
jgi:hypothetical protein